MGTIIIIIVGLVALGAILKFIDVILKVVFWLIGFAAIIGFIIFCFWGLTKIFF